MTDTSLFGAYAEKVRAGTFDEMFAGDARRDNYAGVHTAFELMGMAETRSRADSLASTYLDQGVTFGVAGEEQPFPLDIVPRLIAQADWIEVERGVKQRVVALEAFLDDVYGNGRLFGDGVVPREVVVTSQHFHRVVAGIKPANGVRCHVAGVDLVRDERGDFRVLEDNVRVPSGVSYVMTNRRAMSASLPEVFADHRIRPVSDYSLQLLDALRAAAPAGVSDPTVVVLTPGVFNSAYFEHALLARTMGIELVEGGDLVCTAGRVMMRTTRGLQPVHVIYRRIDDEFLDPVHFRADSILGVPGLITASRAGNVTIANAVGNGIADDKLLYTYVPDLIRYYLSEEPVLNNIDTWRVGDAQAREEVLDRIDELVLKPVDGSGGKGIVIGPAATRAELDELRLKVLADPRAWIAQPVISLSTAPTLVDEGIRPRHVDLRPFAVNDGDDVWVLPGGLTRVALPEGELIVNSSRGGGSKDTWIVRGPEDIEPADEASEELPERHVPSGQTSGIQPEQGPAIEDVDGQQQQQQQQQQAQTQSPSGGGLAPIQRAWMGANPPLAADAGPKKDAGPKPC